MAAAPPARALDTRNDHPFAANNNCNNIGGNVPSRFTFADLAAGHR